MTVTLIKLTKTNQMNKLTYYIPISYTLVCHNYLNSRYLDGGIKKLLFKNAALKRYQITTTFFILGFEDAGAAAIHCQNAFDTKHFLLFSFLFVYLFFE